MVMSSKLYQVALILLDELDVERANYWKHIYLV